MTIQNDMKRLRFIKTSPPTVPSSRRSRPTNFLATALRAGRRQLYFSVPEKYAMDDDGDQFSEVHVNTMKGSWSLLRS